MAAACACLSCQEAASQDTNEAEHVLVLVGHACISEYVLGAEGEHACQEPIWQSDLDSPVA